jgi:hypothetical protein
VGDAVDYTHPPREREDLTFPLLQKGDVRTRVGSLVNGNELADDPVYSVRIPDRMRSRLRWIRRTRLGSGLQTVLEGAVGLFRRGRSSLRASQTSAKGAA